MASGASSQTTARRPKCFTALIASKNQQSNRHTTHWIDLLEKIHKNFIWFTNYYQPVVFGVGVVDFPLTKKTHDDLVMIWRKMTLRCLISLICACPWWPQRMFKKTSRKVLSKWEIQHHQKQSLHQFQLLFLTPQIFHVCMYIYIYTQIDAYTYSIYLYNLIHKCV